MSENNLSRRYIVKRAILACSSAVLGSLSIGVAAQSSDVVKDNSAMSLNLLIGALRTTGKLVCIREAERLEGLLSAAPGIDLHLRRAELQLPEAVTLAEALHRLDQNNTPALRSFSVSHNPELNDDGVIALIKAFPPTLTEVGLVECGFGDAGAEVLLDWLQGERASNLRMICLEKNLLSNGMRQRFSSLRKKHSNLMVIT